MFPPGGRRGQRGREGRGQQRAAAAVLRGAARAPPADTAAPSRHDLRTRSHACTVYVRFFKWFTEFYWGTYIIQYFQNAALIHLIFWYKGNILVTQCLKILVKVGNGVS